MEHHRRFWTSLEQRGTMQCEVYIWNALVHCDLFLLGTCFLSCVFGCLATIGNIDWVSSAFGNETMLRIHSPQRVDYYVVCRTNLEIAYNESQHDVAGRQGRRQRGICMRGLTCPTWRRTMLRSLGPPPHVTHQLVLELVRRAKVDRLSIVMFWTSAFGALSIAKDKRTNWLKESTDWQL